MVVHWHACERVLRLGLSGLHSSCYVVDKAFTLLSHLPLSAACGGTTDQDFQPVCIYMGRMHWRFCDKKGVAYSVNLPILDDCDIAWPGPFQLDQIRPQRLQNRSTRKIKRCARSSVFPFQQKQSRQNRSVRIIMRCASSSEAMEYFHFNKTRFDHSASKTDLPEPRAVHADFFQAGVPNIYKA